MRCLHQPNVICGQTVTPALHQHRGEQTRVCHLVTGEVTGEVTAVLVPQSPQDWIYPDGLSAPCPQIDWMPPQLKLQGFSVQNHPQVGQGVLHGAAPALARKHWGVWDAELGTATSPPHVHPLLLPSSILLLGLARP